ncbi:hypothetical protein ABB37_01931 [Leptomonas pyrrhocoris]|uniref:Uncharacterized protein n=1 Tax=Leptomonas pyrrhocoris TaxID=157538 RepID=A0A0N0DY37_LEPPY|nr:hypothetical protein ABB37_01931 [Leptomonas pyrrhocoris]KPA83672.1 hypothetical protein ABB37_01931 [Leptomonas pyrrhocoris]|eukprot:XP_015662111.1 hypothetical protein ABB37_01931 [Leptomonas pyrrhocoris]
MGCKSSKTKNPAKATAKEQKKAAKKKEEKDAQDAPQRTAPVAEKAAVTPAVPPAVPAEQEAREAKPPDDAPMQEEVPLTAVTASAPQQNAGAAPDNTDAAPAAERSAPPPAPAVADEVSGAVEPQKLAGDVPHEGEPKPTAAAAEDRREGATKKADKATATVEPTAKATTEAQTQTPLSPLSPPLTSTGSRSSSQRIVKPVPSRFLKPKGDAAAAAATSDSLKEAQQEERKATAAPPPAADTEKNVSEKARQPSTLASQRDNGDGGAATVESLPASETQFSHQSYSEGADGPAGAGADAVIYGGSNGDDGDEDDAVDRKPAEPLETAEPSAATQPSPSAPYSVVPIPHAPTPCGEAGEGSEEPQPRPAPTAQPQQRSQQPQHPEVFKAMPPSPSENVSTLKVAPTQLSSSVMRRQRSPAYRCLSDGRTPSVGRHPNHVRTIDTKNSSEAASRSRSHSQIVSVSPKKALAPELELAGPVAEKEKQAEEPEKHVESNREPTPVHDDAREEISKAAAASSPVPPPQPSQPFAVHTRPSPGTSPTAATAAVHNERALAVPPRASDSTRKPRTATPAKVRRNTSSAEPRSTSNPPSQASGVAAGAKKTPRAVHASGAEDASPAAPAKAKTTHKAASKSRVPDHTNGAHHAATPAAAAVETNVEEQHKPEEKKVSAPQPAEQPPQPMQPPPQKIREEPAPPADKTHSMAANEAAGKRQKTEKIEKDSDAEKEVELPAAQRPHTKAAATSPSQQKAAPTAAAATDGTAAQVGGDRTVAVAGPGKEKTEDQLTTKPEPEWHVIPSAEPVERPSMVNQMKTVVNMRNLTAI